MKVVACLRFAAISSSISACRAQIAIVDQGISSAVEGIVASYLDQPGRTIYTPVEVPSSVAASVDVASSTGVASSVNVVSSTSVASDSSTSSTTPPASVTLSSTTTPIPSASVTTSTPTSPPSSTSIANLPSTIPSLGLSRSEKVGIGVGVPLGVISLAAIGFLVQRHRRHKKDSRLRHHDNVAAAGLNPAINETEKIGEKDKIDRSDVEDSSGLLRLARNGVHEIHGTEITAYSRELPGSPGVRRHEVPISPDSG